MQGQHDNPCLAFTPIILGLVLLVSLNDFKIIHSCASFICLSCLQSPFLRRESKCVFFTLLASL